MKKLLLTILFFMSCSMAHATTWFACTSGGNWSNNVWTSIMADQATCAAALGTPVAGDTATLNSASGNITVTANAAAAFLDETGYVGTLTLNSAFNLTLTTGANLNSVITTTGTAVIQNSGGTITLLSTVTGTTIPVLKLTASQILVFGGFTWPGGISLNATAAVYTLSNSGNPCQMSGLLNVTAASTLTPNTAESIIINGGMTLSGTLNGTAAVTLGGGTWSGGSGISNNLTFAGNVTISGSVNFSSANMTYSSGLITTTGSTITVTGTMTLDVSSITWNNFTISGSGAPRPTLSSDLIGNTFNMGNLTIFSGAHNIIFNNYNQGGGETLEIAAGQTMFIKNSMSIANNTQNSPVVQSATASSPAYINFTGALSNETVAFTKFTDIYAYGLPIYNYGGGTLTRTLNVKNVNASNINPKPIIYYNGV